MGDQAMRRVSLKSLADGGEALLMAHGAPRQTARAVLDVLLTGEARGHASHGLLRLPRVVEGIRAGRQDPRAQPVIEERGRACLLADGRFALGPFAAVTIMDAVIERTRSHGLCLACAHGIHHFGIGGYYTDRAARQGLIGLALCNTQPAAAPFGGRRRTLGTNPISFSCPSAGDQPITLDMATTAVARGKLLDCKLRGVPLPEGVAADPDGRMTTDPEQGLAGALLPLGGLFGFKGSGLALMVDILAGALSGAATATRVTGTLDADVPCTAGYCFLAADPDFFCGRKTFADEVRRLVEDVRASGPDVLLPGERAHGREALARRQGVDVPESLADTLNTLAVARGLPPILP
jgi:L-2-hydroxycarboxylate dehydrogenase (NAD+)